MPFCADQFTATKPNTHERKNGVLRYRHVEMLRDDMSLQKKEAQSARADISDAVAVTANIDGRFLMLESQMQGLLKKVTDDLAAHDKAAADRPSPVIPVSKPAGSWWCMHGGLLLSSSHLLNMIRSF